YRTVVVEDACAAIDSILHESALFHLAHQHGRVLKTEEVVRELDEAITRGGEHDKGPFRAQVPSQET
ncbi:MAG TPA: hypothetical protein VGQ60_03995, partial [Nitrospiraceae bacterium]|nr:hypothetical protein [Nitrospiraceae bacterium]